MKILFMEHNYRHLSWKDVFLVFWKNLVYLYGEIIRFQVKVKITIRTIWLDKKEFSYLTVDLRDICSSLKRFRDTDYDWNRLEKSIVKYGVLNPLEVLVCNNFDPLENKMCKYRVGNGNHRILILKKLYPPTYKVKIKINNNVLNK